MEKVIGRINVHFPVAHQYSYTYTTFIQYGHKKNIGRINVHFFSPLVHQYSHFCWQYCRVGIGRFNRLDKLRLIHKADFIDSWEDMSGEGISESSESAKYKSQLFRHSCQTTLFIGRNEMLLSNWKGFVSWTTHSGCQTLKGRSKAFRKIK